MTALEVNARLWESRNDVDSKKAILIEWMERGGRIETWNGTKTLSDNISEETLISAFAI